MNRCCLILIFALINIFGPRCIAHQQAGSDIYYVVFRDIFDETNLPATDSKIRMEGSDESLITTFTDDAGYCIISNLSGENSYSLYIDKYLCFTERHIIRAHDSCFMNTDVEIRLVPMVIDFIYFPVLQFRHGSTGIKVDSAFSESMEYMNFMMKENPTTVLQISRYTEPGERSGLAEKRAKKISQYFIDGGIDKDQFLVDPQPASHAVVRYNNDGCHPVPVNFFIIKEFLKTRSKADQQRIRQECRQVRFEIISTDYNPTKK